MDPGEEAERPDKSWISGHGFVEQRDLLERITTHNAARAPVAMYLLGAQVKVIGFGVARRPGLERSLFLRREQHFEVSRDLLGDLALKGKEVGQCSIVAFRPKLCPCARVAQLSSHSDTIVIALHGAF